jgi:hypothetical protein
MFATAIVKEMASVPHKKKILTKGGVHGVSGAYIMALTGQKDFSAYAKYLRDLGLTIKIKDMNGKSRKI